MIVILIVFIMLCYKFDESIRLQVAVLGFVFIFGVLLYLEALPALKQKKHGVKFMLKLYPQELFRRVMIITRKLSIAILWKEKITIAICLLLWVFSGYSKQRTGHRDVQILMAVVNQ